MRNKMSNLGPNAIIYHYLAYVFPRWVEENFFGQFQYLHILS